MAELSRLRIGAILYSFNDPQVGGPGYGCRVPDCFDRRHLLCCLRSSVFSDHFSAEGSDRPFPRKYGNHRAAREKLSGLDPDRGSLYDRRIYTE